MEGMILGNRNICVNEDITFYIKKKKDCDRWTSTSQKNIMKLNHIEKTNDRSIDFILEFMKIILLVNIV